MAAAKGAARVLRERGNRRHGKTLLVRWSPSWGILSRAQRQVRGAQGYCPIARAERFEHTPLFAIANQLGKTEAQVAIRWSLQQGCVTIPKSSNTDRIRENASVFDFTIPAVRACFSS